MRMPFASGTPLIGVELSPRWLKAFQILKRGQPVCARVERRAPDVPFSGDDASVLAGVLERAGFAGRRVVLVPPRDHVLMDVVELPPRSSGAPLGELARIELARTNRCDPHSFELGWWELPSTGRGGDQSHVFAAAMPFSRSTPILDACDEAGLEVHAIDAPPNALARSYGHTPPDAMLDIGWSGGMLCVMHSGLVVYERTIDEAGLRTVIGPLATRFGIPSEAVEQLMLASAGGEAGQDHPLASELRGPTNEYLDRVATEVQRSLAYMAHRHPQWRLHTLGFTGDGACLSGLREKLASVLGASVSAPAGVGVPFAMAAGASAFGSYSASQKGAA
jgi:Tfp pilus assembly PilM family ATPase